MKSVKYYLTGFLFLAFLGMVNHSCTNLDEEIFSDLDGETFFDNPDNLIFAFGTVYTNMYWTFGNKYGVGRDCGTDLTVVPQRHGDWFDGGEWHRYHRLEWTPSDSYIEFWWNLMYKGVNLCNSLIFQFEAVGTEEANIAIAELRAFRALYYYWLMDVFGNVPLVTKFDVPADFAPSTNSRAEVFSFIEQELIESMPLLVKEHSLATYGRVNWYVAQMTLAKMYLNAEVYTGTAQWEKAETALDAIISSGEFSLPTDYFASFKDDGWLSDEVILGVPMDETKALGLEVHLFSLHYNLQEKFGMGQLPWNGMAVQESLFNLFEENDIRRNGLLFGPQLDAEGAPIEDPDWERFDPTCPTCPKDTDGAGVNLTPFINELEPDCIRQAGARVFKWQIEPGSERYLSNDVPVFRYADVLLMKAEVLIRLGRDSEAPAFFNMVRQRAGVADLPIITLDDILDERARELFVEGHRRTDLIRFGKYLGTRWEKDEVSPDHVILWPIPQAQISANGNLDQNPGY